MQRKDNESYLSYVRRVTEACSDKRITYSEWGDCVLGAENVYSSDNLRKAFYCVSKMLTKVTDDSVSDSDILEEIEARRDEAFKERCKLQDANREKRKYLREEARFENLLEVVKDSFIEIDVNEYKPIDDKVERKYAIAQWSD